jgi:hypothetical protein
VGYLNGRHYSYGLQIRTDRHLENTGFREKIYTFSALGFDIAKLLSPQNENVSPYLNVSGAGIIPLAILPIDSYIMQVLSITLDTKQFDDEMLRLP